MRVASDDRRRNLGIAADTAQTITVPALSGVKHNFAIT
jgi:hypothetical protein